MKEAAGLARKGHGGCDVLWAPTAGDALASEQLIEWCPVRCRDHAFSVYLNGAGEDRVDADAVGAEFAGEGAGQLEEPGFGPHATGTGRAR
jgi:hypothetical protein